VGAARAAAGDGARIAVLDDGFQHRRLGRDVDVVLLAADDPLPARPLPWGPYREGLRALRRADLVLVTARGAGEHARRERVLEVVARAAPGIPVFPLDLAPGGWMDLEGRPTGGPGDRGVLAVCSIARPEQFRAMVSQLCAGPVELVAFPDHWGYVERDLAAICAAAGDRVIATTEKDAVKLREHADRLPETRVLRLGVEEGKGTEALRQAVAIAVRTARRAEVRPGRGGDDGGA
jgi:tetraacyldisaccharide 4'-kinase